jgi:protocatechuate 3,4-dioxygenase beta subunit
MDKASQREARRSFLKRASVFAVALPTGILLGCARPAQTQPTQAAQRETKPLVGGGCDGCELVYDGMPAQLNPETRIAAASEPGEPLEVSGVIYQADGKTPAPGVILYLYHTDANGIYSPAPDATGGARRHGHLRGWIKTNANGAYKFLTIKPASYPNANIPAHIHPIVKEPDKNEYWIDEYVFDNDPLLVERERSRRQNRGGSGIVRLTKNSDGVWLAKRDITLGLNVPNYR